MCLGCCLVQEQGCVEGPPAPALLSWRLARAASRAFFTSRCFWGETCRGPCGEPAEGPVCLPLGQGSRATPLPGELT